MRITGGAGRTSRSALPQPTDSRPTRSGVRGAWLAVLVAGIVLFEGVRVALATTNNIHYAPALILLGAATIPFAFVTFLSDHGPRVQTPAVVLGGTAVVGGVVGVIAAGLLEYDTLQRLGAVPVLATALIEETAKLVAPAALLLVPRLRRGVGDGLVLGVAAGAGFAVLETMGYAIAALVRSHDNLAVIDATLLHRGLLSPASHMAWTGLTVAALWHAAAHHWRGRDILTCALAFVTAVGLHTCWDAIGTLVCYVVLAVVGLALLFGTAYLLGQHHRAVVSRPVDP